MASLPFTHEEHPLDKLQDPITYEKFALKIKKAFSGRFFPICETTDALSVINQQGSSMAYKELRPLHCVDWSEMTGTMKAHVMQTVAVGMIYSPILEAMGEKTAEEDLVQAQLILKNILYPARKNSNSLEDKSSHLYEHVTVDAPTKEKSLLQKLLRR